MQPALKTRLLGAAVLIALLMIVVPLFFSGKPGGSGSQNISLDIPQTPDQALQTRTMSVASVPQSPTSTAVSGDRLATVDIPSKVPPEVRPDQASARDAASVPTQTDQSDAGQAAASGDDKASIKKTEAPAPGRDAGTTANPGKAAVGRYQVNLGAYANKANAEKLMTKARALGYPLQLNAVSINGKPAARVDVGPFDSRAAAESARLKLRAALPRAPVKLTSAPSDQHGNAPARTKAATATASKARAGGWAVQMVAYSKQSDADKLRDKLRAAGFDGYVDDIKSGGHTLWRVRVGPQTQRSDAVSVQKRLKDKFPRLNGVVVTVP